MPRHFRFLPLAFAALALACGGTANEPATRDGYAALKKILEDAGANPTWQAELDLAVTNNAPLTPFVIAHLPPGVKFRNFRDKSCADPWCVAIKTAGPGTFTIEAYGESTARPIESDTIKAY